METRICKKCEKSLPLDKEHFRSWMNEKLGTNGFRRICRWCRNEQTLEHYRSPENKKRYRERHLKKTYNITIQDYERMFKEQDGVCFLCKQTCQTKQLLSVDHNHKTGRVRKLLCQQCNIGLGSFRDDIDLLLKAIQYLRDHDS